MASLHSGCDKTKCTFKPEEVVTGQDALEKSLPSGLCMASKTEWAIETRSKSVRDYTPSLFQELKHVGLLEQHHVADLKVGQAFMSHPIFNSARADPAKLGHFVFPPESILAVRVSVCLHA